jgi:hypothetical protein
VHEPGPVHGGQRPYDVQRHGHRPLRRQRAVLQQPGQGLPVDQVHDQVRAALVGADLMDADQPGVMDAGQQRGLAAQGRLGRGVLEDLHRVRRAVGPAADVQHRRGGSATQLAHHFEPGNHTLLSRATLTTHTCLSAREAGDLSDSAGMLAEPALKRR